MNVVAYLKDGILDSDYSAFHLIEPVFHLIEPAFHLIEPAINPLFRSVEFLFHAKDGVEASDLLVDVGRCCQSLYLLN